MKDLSSRRRSELASGFASGEIAHGKDEYVVYDRLHHIQIYVHAMVKMRCVDRDRREKRGLYPDRSRADAGGSGGSIRNRLKLPKSQNQKSKI